MAFRRPLYLYNNHLREMSDSMISDIRNQALTEYRTNPSVALSVVSSGGSLGTINDTRLKAGSGATNVSRYPTEAETAEPTVVTVGYSRLQQSVTNTNPPSDNGYSFPAYYTDTGHIRSMTLQDMYDTFGYSAIDSAIGASQLYRVHSSNSYSGYSLVSTTPVFSDTGANTGAYTADSIYETLDQPTTRTNYYLMRINTPSDISYTIPSKVDSSGNIDTYTYSEFNAVLQDMMRHIAAEVTGYRIRFGWNTSGTTCGSAVDTRLNGSGNYQTRFVDGNDYRAQEFPNGSFVTNATYNLRVRKE